MLRDSVIDIKSYTLFRNDRNWIENGKTKKITLVADDMCPEKSFKIQKIQRPMDIT